jgi:hypothetical protein
VFIVPNPAGWLQRQMACFRVGRDATGTRFGKYPAALGQVRLCKHSPVFNPQSRNATKLSHVMRSQDAVAR